MFDIGFFELVVLAVVGLLVLGPQRLPQAIRTLGLYIGRIRKMVSGIQQEVNEQLQLEEMRERLAEHEKKVRSGLLDVEKELTTEMDLQQLASEEASQVLIDKRANKLSIDKVSASQPKDITP
ncbi:MAG TPA: Sec-independent protein translocase protein TatB [Marinospirillum sp.]|uniref:Sec-independent protein translocase protein TatB n=1 Tax=Marinospirillum sp. TaxID=2183934 RepID=UPI002B49B6C1|nr:Sec-independent protein translocase protein TatB [Marinospirillum sp.]HKM14737.1 Sec-independent protein translocase protein TatB [Marinospirillum sp.]